jgi:hypothetical protein
LRLNRAIRTRQVKGLTKKQAGALIYGPSLAEPLGFDGAFRSEAEERDAWRRNRALLMKDHEPGRRPFAFFKFELGVQSQRWSDEICALIDADQIGALEAAAIDKTYPMLSGNYPPPRVEIVDQIQRSDAGASVLDNLAATCEMCARFHAFRGRLDLAEQYHLRAGEFRKEETKRQRTAER